MSLNVEETPVEQGAGAFRRGVIACLPTIPGYWSIGFAAGAIGTLAGFSVPETALLAGLLYTGSAQFLFYSLWAAGAEMLSVALSVLLVNMRYLLMSSSLSLWFRNSTTMQKLISGLLLTDETFGVAAQYGARCGSIPFAWMLGLNVVAWLNWILACVVGAWLATALPASLIDGLGFSLVSMFIGLLLMTWFASRRKALETLTIAVAVAVTLATVEHLESSLVVILAATLAATLATLALRFTAKGESK